VKVIAVANQKGGVGKTTSAINLATEIALKGSKVILIDLDPQANATSGVGSEVVADKADLYDVFLSQQGIKSLVVPTSIKNLSLVAGSRDLVSIEVDIGGRAGREMILKAEIESLAAQFDYVLFDCPPSSGLLTLNALGCAHYLLVPLQAEYYALEGLSQLMMTVDFVTQTFNPSLQILGVFMTMFDARTNLSTQVEGEVERFFGDRLFRTRIPRSVRLSESPSHGLPIALYDGNSIGAKAYRALADEVLARISSPQVRVAVS
jgi:chromosome partitioning protein